MYTIRIFIVYSCLLAASTSCKKTPPAGAGGPEPAKDAAAPAPTDAAVAPPDAAQAAAVPLDATSADATEFVVPTAFVKFEALLLPLVRQPQSEARSAKTCKTIEELRIAGLAVQRSMPKGVDAAAWEAASKEMNGAFDGMGATCTDDPPNDSPDLAIIHKSYARMLELVPQ